MLRIEPGRSEMAKSKIILAGLVITTALSGCATQMRARGASNLVATAQLRDSAGIAHGAARIERVAGKARVTVDASELPPGDHGLHIHTVGLCEGPAFASAGPHWNPDMKMHGRDNPMGAHRGDLPNLQVGTDGAGTVSFDLPGEASALLDADGASIVVHAAPDDYKTDPSGNSGGRIACGVFAAG
jgi:Cu-Zn family superoxide dismutase